MSTVYLITGPNRGIGLGLVAALLLRPHTTVTAVTRNSETDTTALLSLPSSTDSTLLITPRASLLSFLADQKIAQIDIIIANAGTANNFAPMRTTPAAAILADFTTNTLGPIELFQALLPFRPAKLALITSFLGSIGGAIPNSGSYGISKAAANFAVRRLAEEEDVVGVCVHPGWVKTENGQKYADSVGVKEPPMEMDQSVAGIMEIIDGATKESAQKFWGVMDEGVRELAW